MEGKKVNNFQPIEEIVLMRHVEYYVSAVTDCSSRFNYSNSVYYSPRNLIGRYERYPAYGDFPETYSLRTYGTWWKESEGYQSDYRPQDADPLGAQDFLVVRFEGPAIPRQIFIYEVYNPGAVVRIWGKIVYKIDLPWKLLWEGPPQTHSHNSRLFQPQITPINEMINSIRLEFNQSHLEYHYSIDAILLGGFQPWSDLMNTIFLEGFTAISIPKGKRAIQNIPNINEKQDIISYLPYELLVHIFQFLDLKSLSKCAQVSRKWKLISEEQSLWQSINLKPYWHLVNYSTLNYFKQKCKNLKKLDLSWCGNDLDSLGFACSSLLEVHAKTLTHLSLGNCEFVNEDLLMKVSCCSQLTDLRLKDIRYPLRNWPLNGLTKLISLDLMATNISDTDMINILIANPHLRHINLDLCESFENLDAIILTVSQYNKELVTWRSWKAVSLTEDGIRYFAKCSKLKELDLGWCLINNHPGNCLLLIAKGCPNLKRLILSEWRCLNDQLLMPIISSCIQLRQLDLMGIKTISGDICGKALRLLPKLRLLDISYCDMIRQEEVSIWREKYPSVKIQRSCEFAGNDREN